MGLTKNFAYSSILIVSNYISPLIVFPYISRVLGVTNIGICSFVDSIINYFILFSMLGISAVGIRETAAVKTDKDKLNEVFSSLITLNGLLTIAFLGIFIICTLFISKFSEYQDLLYIGSFKLLFNFLLMEWLYTGLEDFKYITLRSIFIKLLYICAVFLFVREEDDYDIYFALTVLSVVVNAAVNIIRSRYYVSYKFSMISLKKYLKSDIILGLYMILTAMYTTFNIIFLGFVSTNDEVGYFSTAYKLIIIVLSVYTAWTNVVMPRVSSLYSDGGKKQFNDFIEKSISVLLCLSIPIIILCLVFSNEILLLVVGVGYEKASVSFQILTLLIFIIGYSQIMVMQVLIPIKADKQLIFIAAVSAGLGLLINICIVPLLKSVGTSISWISSELCVLIMAQFFIAKRTGIKFPINRFLQNVIAYLPALLICILIKHFVSPTFFLNLILASLFVLVYLLLIQSLYLKNPFVITWLNVLRDKYLK